MNAVFALQCNSPILPAAQYPLGIGVFILGRSSKCNLVVRHETISRHHAEVILKPNCTAVRDLGSRNGTFIDDRRIVAADLQVGQHVRFGSIGFVLTSSEVAQDDLESEDETAKCVSLDSLHSVASAALSKAQIRVLNMLLHGLGEKQVAARLCISPTTVHNHIQAIYRSFKVHSRAELLVRLLAKEGNRIESPDGHEKN